MLSFFQVYRTSRNNTYLNLYTIGMWILNALLYAVVICMVYYYTLEKTFESFGLYEFGTTVFVGLCMALQCKVAFLHHQWTWPQAFVMALSIGGMFIYFQIIANIQMDYLYVTNWLYLNTTFWFYGFFSVPLFCMFIDVIAYNVVRFMNPSPEMLFREIEHSVRDRHPVFFHFHLIVAYNITSPTQLLIGLFCVCVCVL